MAHDAAAAPSARHGYGAAWDITFSFASSFAAKAAIFLSVPDILAKAGPQAALSPQEIAATLPSEFPNFDFLSRFLRFLASKGILRLSRSVGDEGQIQCRYSLTEAGMFFVVDGNPSNLAQYMLFQVTEPFQTPWHLFHRCVLEGREAFKKAHGKDVWTYMKEKEQLKDLCNAGMASSSAAIMPKIFQFYNGFNHIHSLADVGGGIGGALRQIATAFPHIQGINFDLPHVIATAPDIPGVVHVGGNMFESVPSAEGIFMKRIMHDWNDESCWKILRNCRKALPPQGRLIIVDMVLDEMNPSSPLEQRKLTLDMVMIALTGEGKERSEREWRHLLSSAGFDKVHIYGNGFMYSVIEAFHATQ